MDVIDHTIMYVWIPNFSNYQENDLIDPLIKKRQLK